MQCEDTDVLISATLNLAKPNQTAMTTSAFSSFSCFCFGIFEITANVESLTFVSHRNEHVRVFPISNGRCGEKRGCKELKSDRNSMEHH